MGLGAAARPAPVTVGRQWAGAVLESRAAEALRACTLRRSSRGQDSEVRLQGQCEMLWDWAVMAGTAEAGSGAGCAMAAGHISMLPSCKVACSGSFACSG